TENWDRSVSSVTWSPDSASLYVTALDTLDEPAFRVDLAGGKVHRLTGAGHVAALWPLPRGGIVYALDTLTAPADLWKWEPNGKGATGDTVWGWAMRPAQLAAGAKAPIAFLVHGGPQGSFGESWSYRWNPMAWAGHGFAVVSVDFHGSTGYGAAFQDAINRNW